MEPRFESATCTRPARGSGRHGRCAAEPREKKRRGRRRRPKVLTMASLSAAPAFTGAKSAMRHNEPNAGSLALGSPRCDTARSSRDDPRARRRRAPTERPTAGIRPLTRARRRTPRPAAAICPASATCTRVPPASTCSPCRKTSWRRACSAASTPPGTSRFEISVASRGTISPLPSFPALSRLPPHARSPPVPARIFSRELERSTDPPLPPRATGCSPPRRARPSRRSSSSTASP